MMKRVSIVTVCSFIALVFAFGLPGIGTTEDRVDNSTCLDCHVNGQPVHDLDTVLHNTTTHFITGECDNCHENAEPVAGNVKASACLACHPADQAGPGVNAGKCDLIDFHMDNADYQASGESCLASGCHLDQCNAPSTTSSVPASTTTSSIDGGGCPASEIYGEGSMEVKVMRAIRDDVMNRTPEGREMVKLYYQWAPFIAEAIRNDKELRAELREMVDGILGLTVK